MENKVVIDGKTLTISKFGAKEGWKMVRKLAVLFGPALAKLTDDDYSGAVEKVLSKLPEEEFMFLLEQLTGSCLVDGAKYSEVHLSDYMFTIKVMKAVMEHNFSDFFSPIKKAMAGLGND